jgi:hypothetical protein
MHRRPPCWQSFDVLPVLALTHHAGVRLAEVGFLLLLFGGVWLAAAQIPAFGLASGRTVVAGFAGLLRSDG